MIFFGSLAVAAGLMPVAFISFIRIFQRVGMTLGGVGRRPGESPHDYQERAKRYDSLQLERARRLRPFGYLLAVAGLIVVAVGIGVRPLDEDARSLCPLARYARRINP